MKAGRVVAYPASMRPRGTECDEKAAERRVKVEVLSPTMLNFETMAKLGEYQAVESPARIVVIEPNGPEVVVWARGEGCSWQKAVCLELDRAVAIPGSAQRCRSGAVRHLETARPFQRCCSAVVAPGLLCRGKRVVARLAPAALPAEGIDHAFDQGAVGVG